MQIFFFYLFAFLTLCTALGVITFRNPVSSALSLIGSFFGIAALYAILSAHLLAVIQILVYAGAIMVLFVFVIMLLNLKEEEIEEKRPSFLYKIGVGLLSLGFLTVLLSLFRELFVFFIPVEKSYGTIRQIGSVLFSNYFFPFEFISLLIVVGLIGTILLAKKKL